jgi:antirestriction protein ArdC
MKTENTKLSNKDIVEGLSQKIDESIDELINSDDWTKYLSFVKGQHPYSWNNTFLIQFEGWMRGFTPSYVRGAKQWNKVGRTIIKGQKAIWILAPRFGYNCAEKTCMNSKVFWNKNLKRMVCNVNASHRTEKQLWGFMGVPVFDISQTEGDEIEFITLKERCEGATKELWDNLVVLAELNNFKVTVGDAKGSDGFCDPNNKSIVVDENTSFGYQVKTLVHELAHMLLHKDLNEYRENRARFETEAECVAWIVCQALGVHSDGDKYSFGYIKNWGGDNAKALVKSSLARIQKTATEILDSIEKDMESL